MTLARWWYFAKPSLASIKRGHSPFIRCPNCECLKFAEDIILNCGICGKCFDASYEKFMREEERATF